MFKSYTHQANNFGRMSVSQTLWVSGSGKDEEDADTEFNDHNHHHSHYYKSRLFFFFLSNPCVLKLKTLHSNNDW